MTRSERYKRRTDWSRADRLTLDAGKENAGRVTIRFDSKTAYERLTHGRTPANTKLLIEEDCAPEYAGGCHTITREEYRRRYGQ